MWNKIIVGIGIVLLGISLYFNIHQYESSQISDKAIIAAHDTLHTYNTTYKSLGGYISTIVADRDQAINLLKLDKVKNKDLIDSLSKNKRIQTIAQVTTDTKIIYQSNTDTLLKGIKFTKSINTDWLDEKITVDSNKLTRILDYRDAYIFSNELKKNKGLFTGSTLTTYVSPKNPDTKVTGITSVSTIIDKPKIIINPAVGFGLNSDIKGNNVRLGWSAGIVITIK